MGGTWAAGCRVQPRCCDRWLSSEKLEAEGVFLLENAQELFLWAGSKVRSPLHPNSHSLPWVLGCPVGRITASVAHSGILVCEAVPSSRPDSWPPWRLVRSLRRAGWLAAGAAGDRPLPGGTRDARGPLRRVQRGRAAQRRRAAAAGVTRGRSPARAHQRHAPAAQRIHANASAAPLRCAGGALVSPLCPGTSDVQPTALQPSALHRNAAARSLWRHATVWRGACSAAAGAAGLSAALLAGCVFRVHDRGSVHSGHELCGVPVPRAPPDPGQVRVRVCSCSRREGRL